MFTRDDLSLSLSDGSLFLINGSKKISHPLHLTDDQLKKASSIVRTRRGGPGGQHRNKTDTAIVITHIATGVSAQAGEKRSQHANQTVAVNRLKIHLAIAVRSDPLPAHRSQLWLSRIKNGRISISPSHADFPLIINEALDALHERENDLVATATELKISTSQLVKLLKSNLLVFDHVQQVRKSNDLRPLK